MPRWLLPTLILVATALFVTGVFIERNSEDKHADAESPAAAASDESADEGGEADAEGEAAGGETDEHASEPATQESEEGGEDQLLGIDVESTPLVVLAALASIGLALAAWLRPNLAAVLALIAVVLVGFAALDVREVFHQIDEDKAGLAVLAALVAALHLAASGIAAVTRQRTAA